MIVEIHELTVSYKEGGHALLALDRIALRLAPGRVTALVGESGSGKTTLGKALMKLLPENAEVTGDVVMDRLALMALDESAANAVRWSKMAMVFQNGSANLNPVLPPSRSGGRTIDPAGWLGTANRPGQSVGDASAHGFASGVRPPLSP